MAWPAFGAVLSGILLSLSMPPIDWSILAWCGLVPLLITLPKTSAKAGFCLSFLTGAIFFTWTFRWFWALPAFNGFDYLLLAVYFSLYFGVFGGGLVWLRQRTSTPLVFLAPPLWVGLEYLRANAGFLSAPGLFLAHSQYAHPLIIQMVSLTGTYGLSLVLVVVNVAVFELLVYGQARWQGRSGSPREIPFPVWSPGLAIILLASTLVYGQTVLSRPLDEPTLKLALLQGNIPQKQKWDQSYREATLDRYAQLTRQAALTEPDLIVWPETAVPGDVLHDPVLKARIAKLAVEAKSHVLVGMAESAKFSGGHGAKELYNSMVLFSPAGQVLNEYRKQYLVPFGEYTPLRGVVDWPAMIVEGRSDVLPGDRATLFTVNQIPIGTPICWETLFPDLVRTFVNQGARLLINATNEAWFGESAVPYQMLAISVFRAVENGVGVARVANTGITAMIDPVGRITQTLTDEQGSPLFVQGVLVGHMAFAMTPTLYTRYGDRLLWLLIGLCGLWPMASGLLKPARVAMNFRKWRTMKGIT